MITEDGAEPFVLQVFGNKAVDAAVPFQAQQVGRDLGHVEERVEWLVPELLEADATDFLARLHETGIAIDVARFEFGDLGAHLLAIAAVREGLSVMKADAIERVAGSQLDVVRQAPTAKAP